MTNFDNLFSEVLHVIDPFDVTWDIEIGVARLCEIVDFERAEFLEPEDLLTHG